MCNGKGEERSGKMGKWYFRMYSVLLFGYIFQYRGEGIKDFLFY